MTAEDVTPHEATGTDRRLLFRCLLTGRNHAAVFYYPGNFYGKKTNSSSSMIMRHFLMSYVAFSLLKVMTVFRIFMTSRAP